MASKVLALLVFVVFAVSACAQSSLVLTEAPRRVMPTRCGEYVVISSIQPRFLGGLMLRGGTLYAFQPSHVAVTLTTIHPSEEERKEAEKPATSNTNAANSEPAFSHRLPHPLDPLMLSALHAVGEIDHILALQAEALHRTRHAYLRRQYRKEMALKDLSEDRERESSVRKRQSHSKAMPWLKKHVREARTYVHSAMAGPEGDMNVQGMVVGALALSIMATIILCCLASSIIPEKDGEEVTVVLQAEDEKTPLLEPARVTEEYNGAVVGVQPVYQPPSLPSDVEKHP